MINKFCKTPLWECNRRLVRVAQGLEPADTVIKNVQLVNTCTAEVLDGQDIALASGRIAYVGDASHCIGELTEVIDGTGLVATPGLMDGHMHVESSMVGVAEYARAAVPHGTTGIYMDPHEVANVRGLRGVAVMMEDAARTPLKAMLTTPSCVPAITGFEDTGASIDADDVEETMKWDSCVGLGEMMNFPGVLADDDLPLDEINATLRAGKTVTGHYSTPETDRGLQAYIASGVSCCHESVRPEDALAKIRCGMYAQLRYGSGWHNLPDLVEAILNKDIDTRFCCLVSDDNHPSTMVREGHMDRILRKAVELDIEPAVAVQMCTINTATCFGQQQDLGAIAPGKCADIVLWDNLRDFNAQQVWIDGELAAEAGVPTFELDEFIWPDWMTSTMNVGFDIEPETFCIPAVTQSGEPIAADKCLVRVMEVTPGNTITHEVHEEMHVAAGLLEAQPDQDLLKVFVFERHHATGTFAAGFAKGFGIHGALAQTVAHDAHNLLVLGDNDEDMALAAQTLVRCGGGEVAVQDGKVLGLVELPVCGLMSDQHVEKVANQVAHMEEVWKAMGCTMPSPFMTLSGLSLACIPELRLTDRGYVDCVRFCQVPLVVEE